MAYLQKEILVLASYLEYLNFLNPSGFFTYH